MLIRPIAWMFAKMRCADLAGEKNITVAYEHHAGTLTDTPESSLALLAATEHPFIRTLWQPLNGMAFEDCLADLRLHLSWVQHVHVFHWWPAPSIRLPLADGENRWTAYMRELRQHGIECAMELKFIKGDNMAQLEADAACLRKLCGQEKT